jgi:hypothetical protein
MPSKVTGNILRRTSKAVVSALAPVLILAFPFEGAKAAPNVITVKSDQAKAVAVSGEPATVVVGNPLYADVSVQEKMIVIHGRQFGTTNVLVFDQAGNVLSDIELHVVRGGNANVTVYKAGGSWSYLCAPSCESALQVGDNAEYYNNLNTEISAKVGLSTGASKLND